MGRSNNLFILAAALFLLFCYSCKKTENVTRQSTSASLKPNESFRLSLTNICAVCGSEISRQASHFDSSVILIDSAAGQYQFVYVYRPAKDYVGSDEVEIKQSASGGDNDAIYTTVKFSIAK